jgi:ribonuclease HI
MELSEPVVDFEKISTIKSQVIADFIEEYTEPSSYTEGLVPKSPWLIYCVRAWGNAGTGVTSILISPSEIKLRYAARLQFTKETDKCTNNIVEYEVIMLGLHKVRAIRVHRCVVRTDLKVVSSQIEKECITRELTLEKYLALVRRMENHFKGFTIEHIDINKNVEADKLTKVAAQKTPLSIDVFFQIIEYALVKIVKPEPRLIYAIEGEGSCMVCI